ncbi:MAG: outer membrane beta-barrel protein [Daejeonella sp.]|uniref:outer membrane beta-barrel protein n=1 Tax=Daejeonella sp. TaxID=2805397 RepID=UPI002736A70B|nr:outer membrane beta-barrel protein [Daejeonella sp.]MDP3468758.1 outer membrane beta-barrel protein [Daejeonella sp.]
MSNLSQNKTDKFFRQALKTAPELSPEEKDWNEMEHLLKGKPNKRPVFGWFYWPAGIAAGLLIILSVWLSNDSEIRLTEDGKNEISKVENLINKKQILNSEQEAAIPLASSPDQLKTGQTKTSGMNNAFDKKESRKAVENLIESALLTNTNPEGRNQYLPLNMALFQELRTSNPIPSGKFTAINTISLKSKHNTAKDSSFRKMESSTEKPGGRLALSMAFSTDMNSVNGIGNSKAGLSGGFGISYKISKGLSATTGIYYSQKKYTAGRDSYYTTEKPFATWASYSRQIDADCQVIDIPINMNVLLSRTKKTGIVASAGLSSYIMLSEKYNFIYNSTPTYPSAGREYTIKNANQHILSIVNLSVGVEKPIGNQSSIVIQPYAKLPLSGIGQGATELKSFGIGFQLNYSIKNKNKFFNRQSD